MEKLQIKVLNEDHSRFIQEQAIRAGYRPKCKLKPTYSYLTFNNLYDYAIGWNDSGLDSDCKLVTTDELLEYFSKPKYLEICGREVDIEGDTVNIFGKYITKGKLRTFIRRCEFLYVESIETEHGTITKDDLDKLKELIK